ncbi:capsule assembly Wzi family protein [Longibacter salinarum]|nr:capsule assembly Wzi family protein [Longibacter salinarum]
MHTPLRFLSVVFLLALALVSIMTQPVSAQTDGVLFIDGPAQRFLERQKTLGRLPNTFVSNRPLSAYEMQAALDSLTANYGDELSAEEERWVARLRNEEPQPGAGLAQSIWGRLYPNGRDMAAVTGDGYALQVNPLLYASVGQARFSDSTNVTTWRNTRGVRASGHIGPIFFESRLTENQERPSQVQFVSQGDGRILDEAAQGTAPGLGNVLLQDQEVYDYFTATGVVGFRSRFFEVRFGRDQNSWGFGRESLNVSDAASAYDQLQIRTNVWRLEYTNLFARYTELNRIRTPQRGGNTAYPSRYGAHHRLAMHVTDRFQLEVFESIRFAPQTDSIVNRSNFELGYLNPVIFYRAVERDIGSPDNAMLGIGGSWIAIDGARFYGQFLLDELRVSEIGSGWWGNKWGWILGADIAGVGSDHLSLQAEVARLRPFLYNHFYTPNAYVHYRDPLGHPAGPNAYDVTLSAQFDPPSRWQAGLTTRWTQRGRNPAGENIGADPTLSSRTRSRGYVDMLSGVLETQWTVDAHAGAEILPQLFVEAALRVESTDDEVLGTTRIVQPYVLLRWGLPFDAPGLR